MQNLDEVVLERLLAADTDEAAIDLVLAALNGSDALSAHLEDGTSLPRPDPSSERSSPEGTFLTGLSIEGFRGIGAKTQLRLTPGPGLTLIAGRNGSGKTSVAEALECALTGTARRWERSINASDARSSWRNLHHLEQCEIRVGLSQAGDLPATLAVRWPRTATRVDEVSATYQRQGGKQQGARAALGWQTALETYRPLMSYEDLGRLFAARPSEFHDSIAQALGLDALHDAVALLRDRVGPMKKPLTEAGKQRRVLKADLEQLDDERATTAGRLLGKTAPDLTALGRLVSAPIDGGRESTLAQIVAMGGPDLDRMRTAADDLEAALARLREAGAQRERRDVLRDQLLSAALQLHDDTGDAPCPVCSVGTLDAAWRAQAQTALTDTDLLNSARSTAEHNLRRAEQAARQLLAPPPPVVGQTTVGLATQPAVAERWAAWSSAADAEQLVRSLRDEATDLADLIMAWQQEAADLADADSARWAPFAQRLAAWIDSHRSAVELATQADDLDRAHAAAAKIERSLQEDRLQPIVERTRQIWGRLRRESNVDLVDVALTGSATRRAVEVTAVVDGSDSNAFSVMSQGELNSLALALYLPRATSDESPFRFLVLDDPVQAMDPTKVEGLATVLAELAETRQVIVFSHDDRLAAAVHRLSVPATMLEVTRNAGSEVIISSVKRPYERHLDDAYALLRASDVPEQVKRLVLPGVLRQAIEATAWERYASTRLAAGAALTDVETAWDAAGSTRARVELLLNGRLAGFLNTDVRRPRAIRNVNSGSHQPYPGNLAELHDDVRHLVGSIGGLSS